MQFIMDTLYFSDLLRASLRADEQIKMKNQLEMVNYQYINQVQIPHNTVIN